MTQQALDCFDYPEAGGRLMPVDEAVTLIERRLVPVAETETVLLRHALGRVLAQPQIAAMMVPPYDNSAMDGWAVAAADLAANGISRLPIGGRIAAGHPLTEAVRPGHAYRIFTGAPLPPRLDSVLMQEDCRTEGDDVILPPTQPGSHVRRAGESVTVGDVPLAAGTVLGPAHLGVAATLGLTTVPVRRRLRVAIFSTGDEVIEPGAALPPGCLYDANRPTLAAMLERLGCAVTDLGILADRKQELRAALLAAAPDHDLLITSGGVSVGDEDHVKGAVDSLHLWRLALKPGKPLALGQVAGVPFLGLPGNPVSVMVTFLLVGRPLIARLAGAISAPPCAFPLPAAFTLVKKAGRRELPRARLVTGERGLAVELFGNDSSGVLTSMIAADGFIDLPAHAVTITPGDVVAFLPFHQILP